VSLRARRRRAWQSHTPTPPDCFGTQCLAMTYRTVSLRATPSCHCEPQARQSPTYAPPDCFSTQCFAMTYRIVSLRALRRGERHRPPEADDPENLHLLLDCVPVKTGIKSGNDTEVGTTRDDVSYSVVARPPQAGEAIPQTTYQTFDNSPQNW